MDFTNDDIARFQKIASAPSVPANLPSAKEDEDDRIDSKEVARQTGLSRRAVTARSGRELIPSAKQFGTKWTFDAAIKAWVRKHANGRGQKHLQARQNFLMPNFR